MRWRFSNRVIFIQFRQFSCGKFLSNVLSYNRNFIPSYNLKDNPIPLNQMVDMSNKHSAIMGTLPDPEKRKQWLHYELSCVKFFGFDLSSDMNNPIFLATQGYIRQNVFNFTDKSISNLNMLINPKAKDILENTDYYTFLMTHNDPYYAIYKAVFPMSIDIQIVNDARVNLLSQEIKSNTIPVSHGKFKERSNTFKFDIDTMFNKNDFFDEIFRLLTYFKLEDQTLDDRVYEYYEKYIEMYKPYL